MALQRSPDEHRRAAMTVRGAAVLILLATAAGCAGSRPTATAGPRGTTTTQPELARGCPEPHRPPGGGAAAVDYVDFLRASGRNYIADLGGNRLSIQPADLGEVVLQVRCSYAAVNDATGLVFGEPRDGDAAFLAPGTDVHAVRGWPPLCRLAAVHDHVVHVYLAYRPDATVATPEPCALDHG